MNKSYEKVKIIKNENIVQGIYKLVIEGKFQGRPGQFFMLRGWSSMDPFLARPISICDLEDDRITFLYQVRGRGMEKISKLKVGDSLNILGPLGNGFDLDKIRDDNIALVAGGIGIAPLLYLAKSLEANIDLYAGFRDEVYFLDEFKKYTNNIYVTVENDNQGKNGFITEIIDSEKYDKIIGCGPNPMFKELSKITKDKEKLIFSMESKMACGIGACMGCTIETVRGMERVCKEGPVFIGQEVIFND